MTYKIKRVELEEEFKICPTCNYKDGFHSMIKKQKNSILHLFICPSCHDVFDIGLTVDEKLLNQ